MEKQFLLLACILKMRFSPTPSPPLGGNSTDGDCATPRPLSLHHKAVHQPQQASNILQVTLLHHKLDIRAGTLLGLRKFLLLQLCMLFVGLLLLVSPSPTNVMVDACSKDWVTPQPPCYPPPLLQTQSYVLRLKKVQTRGCFSWKSNPAIRPKHKWTRRAPEQQFKGEPQSHRYLRGQLEILSQQNCFLCHPELPTSLSHQHLSFREK